jgi:hypothetical protein
VRFFLHDNRGNQVVAVIGDDMGDAHYKYHNAMSFQSYGESSFSFSSAVPDSNMMYARVGPEIVCTALGRDNQAVHSYAESELHHNRYCMEKYGAHS